MLSVLGRIIGRGGSPFSRAISSRSCLFSARNSSITRSRVIYQRRPFFRRHLDAGNLDRPGSIHALQETPKCPSE